MISREIVPSSFRNDLPMSRNRTFEPSSRLAIFVLTDVSFSRTRVRFLTAREDTQEQDLGLGQPLPDLFHDRGDTLGDLVGRARADVIRADHEHDDLRRDPLELTVLDSPEDVLGPVAADAEIGRFPRSVEPLPDRVIVPTLGDRIAEEEQVDRLFIPLLGAIEEATVHVHPRTLTGFRDDRLGPLCAGRQAGREQAPIPRSTGA